MLVAHPKVKRSAAELTRTYRAKNAVEADFHVIKGVVKVRPEDNVILLRGAVPGPDGGIVLVRKAIKKR